jgi:hypothetical protein
LERITDQASIVPLAHRPAEQVAGGQVQHAGQVQPALVGGDEGHIPTPGHVDPVRIEQPPQQVWRGWDGRISLGQATPTAWSMADDAVAGHQPLHLFVIGPPAAPAQLVGAPRRPVGASGVSLDGADLGDQLSLGLLGCPRPVLAAGGPGVEGRGRDTRRIAGGDHWEPGGLLGIDAAVAAHASTVP